MKLAISLFLFSIFTFGDKSFSMTDYQIKKVCRKEIKESNCIMNLREKRTNLQEGNLIEIPVIPYKK